MKLTNYSEKIENYKLLSLFIDNIAKYRLVFNKQLGLPVMNNTLLIVRNGVIQLTVRNRTIKLKINDGVFLQRGSSIRLHGLSEEENWAVVITFDGSGVPGMLRYLQLSDGMRFNVSGNANALCLDSMIQYYEAREYFRAAIVLQSLLISIKDSDGRDYRVSNMQEVYQYMQEHFAEPLDLNHLAEIYGTSVSYFSRAFKQYYKIAPMTFVNDVRIRHARMLLETTDLKINEVAGRCGFDKLEYFCYVFKKSAGCTPTQYRLNREYANRPD